LWLFVYSKGRGNKGEQTGEVSEKAHLLPVMHIILSKIIYITLLAIVQKVIIDVARKRFIMI